jgi:hypothetical protein
VSLVASNAQGADAELQVAAVEILPPLPSVTFTPTADARAHSGNPAQNYGSSSTLRARLDVSVTHESYLRFSVSGLVGQRVTQARLRLFVTEPSVEGGTLTVAPGGWNESTLTWDNAPGVGALVVDSVGTVFPDSWVEFDVSALVTGPGSYDFGLSSSASNSVFYSSREGANPPELVVFTAPTVPALDPAGTALLIGALAAIGSRALSRHAPRASWPVSLKRTRRASVAAGR